MTAEELVRRNAAAFARKTLHRVVETVFVVIDSVVAGQVAESLEGVEDE